MKIAAIACVILFVFASGCGGGDDDKYPDSVIKNFMDSCVQSAGGSAEARSICDCSIKEIQKKYNLKQFVELEQQIDRGQAPRDITDIVVKCVEDN